MCLTINKAKHKLKSQPRGIARYVPHIAKDDIVVIKCFKKEARTGRLFSGIRHYITPRGVVEKASFSFSDSNTSVHCGIHAKVREVVTTTLESESERIPFAYEYLNGGEFVKVKDVTILCVIPKGSKYYIGRGDDIVATRMKVLTEKEQTLAKYKKYFKTVLIPYENKIQTTYFTNDAYCDESWKEFAAEYL